MKQQVAVYLRLSQEDVDKRTNKVKNESDSIASQRSLINRHLDQNPILGVLPRIEFCDDGFSGTNFERPAFLRMIESARRGDICCIVVKDLSRFGRDYIEVGDYLEHIFPFLGIRFKSINDHYDSDLHEGSTVGMSIAFKNLIYDYYSKDLSKKVKSAMGLKQREAKYVNCIPYGYKVHPTEKHQIIIDEPAAAVVRRVFIDVIAGKTSTMIAKELNDEGVLTPAAYKSVIRPPESKKQQWTHHTVLAMLHNIKYTGTMVNHTRESRHLRDKNQRRVPKDEWYIRENAHEAIVTQEEYQQAQGMIRRRKSSNRAVHDQSDRVYYCAHCGSKLEKANGTVFACPSHRYHEESLCSLVHWHKAVLEEVIFEALKRQIEVAKVEAAAVKESYGSKGDALLRQLTLLKAQHDACGRDKLAKYEKYREGSISAEEYIEQKDAITQRQTSFKEQIAELEKQYDTCRRENEEAEKMQDAVKDMGGMSNAKLREHLYDAIERVVVHDGKSIEIVWKFNDILTPFAAPDM